jgi:hypothetical protein
LEADAHGETMQSNSNMTLLVIQPLADIFPNVGLIRAACAVEVAEDTNNIQFMLDVVLRDQAATRFYETQVRRDETKVELFPNHNNEIRN